MDGSGNQAVLAIDFGTSSCVVAARQGERRATVELAGSMRTPSVLFADDDGALLVGHLADELATARPARALRSPKARLGQDAPVVLGGRAHAPGELVATVLRWLYTEATGVVGEPTGVVLTHPATWTSARLDALRLAGERAGLPGLRLQPEPVAAAAALIDELDVPAGAHVAVYDLGAGTFDVAVLHRTADGFELVGEPDGDPRIGGDLFDELIEAAVGPRLGDDVWRAIVEADDGWDEAGAQLRRSVRRAKELVSAHDYADVHLTLPNGMAPATVRLRREEVAALLAPPVLETVDRLAAAVAAAGLHPSQLHAVHLVGGASAMPVVIDAVRERFPGVACIRRADPKSVVALGALHATIDAAPPEAGDHHAAGSTGRTRRRRLLLGLAAAAATAALASGAVAWQARGGPVGEAAGEQAAGAATDATPDGRAGSGRPVGSAGSTGSGGSAGSTGSGGSSTTAAALATGAAGTAAAAGTTPAADAGAEALAEALVAVPTFGGQSTAGNTTAGTSSGRFTSPTSGTGATSAPADATPATAASTAGTTPTAAAPTPTAASPTTAPAPRRPPH
ncbi:MAG: Hsp70 family protein [Acidimicrobiales bacterium]